VPPSPAAPQAVGQNGLNPARFRLSNPLAPGLPEMAKPQSTQDPEHHAAAPEASEGDLSFEEALESLEELIRGMESDTLPLEGLIESYERGSRLFQICQTRLDAAEARIELIRKNRNGESVASPFDAADGAPGPAETVDAEAPQKNGELF